VPAQRTRTVVRREGVPTETFVRLLAAPPLTLSVSFLSVVLGGLMAGGVTWMRVSGVKPFELFARAYVLIFRGTP
jgi:octopine/nopaline transport system permease protein